MPGIRQAVLGWSSWEDGGSQNRANVRICLLCAFITLMAVSFLSLPLSLSPPHAAAGTRWAHSPLRPLSAKAGFLQLRLFVCVFFLFPLYVSLPVGSIVSPTNTTPDGGAPALVQPRAHLVSSSCPQMQQVPACSAPSEERLTLSQLEHGVLGTGAHKLWHCTRYRWL